MNLFFFYFQKGDNHALEASNLEDLSPPSSVVAGDDQSRGQSPVGSSHHVSSHRSHKKEKKPVTEASLNLRRRRLWVAICKKEISRVRDFPLSRSIIFQLRIAECVVLFQAQKQKISAHKELLSTCKKVLCYDLFVVKCGLFQVSDGL